MDRSTLLISAGRIAAADGRTLGYGELTRGQRLTDAVTAEQEPSRRDEWAMRGTSVRKVDGHLFVTGRHQFVPDMVRPGCSTRGRAASGIRGVVAVAR